MNWICDKSSFKWCCWNEKLPLEKQIIMFLCTGYIKIKHQNNIIINKLMSISIMSKIQDITMVVFYFFKNQILVEGCTRRSAWWRDIYCSSLRSRSLCGSAERKSPMSNTDTCAYWVENTIQRATVNRGASGICLSTCEHVGSHCVTDLWFGEPLDGERHGKCRLGEYFPTWTMIWWERACEEPL